MVLSLFLCLSPLPPGPQKTKNKPSELGGCPAVGMRLPASASGDEEDEAEEDGHSAERTEVSRVD